jgi:hypothetical protein
MPTVQELTDNYNRYSDEELFGVWIRINEYTPEAKEALSGVIKRRGGPEALIQRLQLQAERIKEVERLAQEARVSLQKGLPPSLVKDQMRSATLPPDEIAEITGRIVAEQQEETKDRKITPGTFLGVLIGGLLGGTVGGIVLGFSMLRSERIILGFVLGAIMVCYGCIRFFTGKTTRNSLVLTATVVAAVYAFVLAEMIYQMSQ